MAGYGNRQGKSGSRYSAAMGGTVNTKVPTAKLHAQMAKIESQIRQSAVAYEQNWSPEAEKKGRSDIQRLRTQRDAIVKEINARRDLIDVVRRGGMEAIRAQQKQPRRWARMRQEMPDWG